MLEQTARVRIEGQVIPTLPARDMDETLAYYESLGFEMVGRYPGEQAYAIVRRDDAELHFYEFPVDPLKNLAGCYLRITDVDALHTEWLEAGIEILQTLTHTDHGMREFAISDPNGNLLKIGSPIQTH
jgi:catechol 2,3-dioxygenase-like lactoylglutathione lyase family enzyme